MGTLVDAYVKLARAFGLSEEAAYLAALVAWTEPLEPHTQIRDETEMIAAIEAAGEHLARERRAFFFLR